ncbi:DMSO reductase, partial [Salmonella enterica subsp. enterica serovar Wilhelmsburg]
ELGVDSLFLKLERMQVLFREPFVYIHPSSAKKKGISENDLVKVFNGTGEVELRAKVTTNVPEDFLVMYEAWFPKRQYNVQNVVADTPADMGLMKTGAPGAAIHSQFADVVLIGKGESVA